MVALKKYNLGGEEVGEIDVAEDFFDVDANRQMIKDYIVALRANARQWSANTKGRSEVKHTTKKPFRQKGTGNARQGSLVSPQYKGGGIVFGPKPKFDQHVRINKKERRLAVRHLLSEKLKNDRLLIVEDGVFNGELSKPRTKEFSAFLTKRSLKGRRVLFVGEGVYELDQSIASDKHDIAKKSTRNIQKCSFSLAPNLNGYDVLVAQGIVMTESAFAEVKKTLMSA